MTNITQIMMSLIKTSVCGINDTTISELSEEDVKALYKLSKSHDLTHLLTSPIEKNKLISDEKILSAFQKQTFTAVYRYKGIEAELEALCNVLEDAKIRFIPLKGSVLRNYYPEPWMRTSCDIDVYVDNEQLEAAITALKDGLGYTEHERCAHDVSLFSEGGIHVELHFELIEDDRVNKATEILSRVWDYTRAAEGYSYRYEMSDDMFYFYHIAHMMKHFEIGGCGVRSFLDIWVLNHLVEYDAEKRNDLLARGDLSEFARGALALSEVWFGNGTHTDLTLAMENYLIGAGAYGSLTNRATVNYAKKGSRFKYFLSRIWIPYDSLKNVYPSLTNKRWLTFFYQIRRWCRVFSKKDRKKLSNEIKATSKNSADKTLKTENMFNELGIKIK